MSKRPSPDTVVDLTLGDSNGEHESQLDDVRKDLSYSPKKVKKESVATKVGAGVRTAVNYKKEGVAVKVEGVRTAAVNYEDVQFAKAPEPAMVAAAAPSNDNDKDIAVVGTLNEVKLPHMRPHCTKFKFKLNSCNRSQVQAENAKHCDLCYCYICDCPVKDCKSWSLQRSLWANHCNATDQQSAWVMRRYENKSKNSCAYEGSEIDYNAAVRSRKTSGSSWEQIRKDFEKLDSKKVQQKALWQKEKGPWSPDHPLASTDSNITKCRKCSWYSKLNEEPWCHKCGRVASNSAISSKEQTVAYHSKPTDFCLGTKKIPFRIVSRNVRAMTKYRTSWTQLGNTTPTWTYDELEMEEEVFQHRLGTRPTLRSILRLISILEEDKMREIAENGGVPDMAITEENIEAMFLQNPSDLSLLRLLHTIGSFGTKRDEKLPNCYPVGDITAKWMKESRSGVISIRVFLPANCIGNQLWSGGSESSLLVGAWFDCFPFNLVDLSGPFKAKCANIYDQFRGGAFKLYGAAQEKMIKAVADHNDAANRFCSQMSLTCSSGYATVGGITNNDTTMKNILQRFFRETCRDKLDSYGENRGWLNLEMGFVSNHRSFHHGLESCFNREVDLMLSFRDCNFATSCLVREAHEQLPYTTAGLMEHLENLGHESEVHLEGLQCELLPFQKQSLKWALERERVYGGIQRYFWVEVPVQVGVTNTALYYNPILNCFRKCKPRVVRGGIIAEEMGLGKTIISLALILKNPAPEFPISGSPIASLSAVPEPPSGDASKWDNDVLNKTATDSPLRASILSRGTLVICPVSLVGQWIEEAKSKLEDPGLIYPYHGQSRKRDANVLAKNAIVVTTYQVLASDATYHRAKSNDENYCPPLEQIRWWRIICDEGHALRDATTKRNQSICNLVADHKWLVSGTPINTSIMDLKNQLKFLGIEQVDDLFRVFSSWRGGSLPGELLFFLRSIMMRHRQNQTYRGTKTTLMSLPPKTERSIEVTLTPSEKNKYDMLDADAKTFYIDFKAGHLNDLSSHYLKLSQKLTPMRVACSGGFFPLEDEDEKEIDDDNCGEDEEDKSSKGRKKKMVKYSDFAFTSKFKVLLSELERIRDKDPSSKSLVFSQYSSTLDWLKEELPKHGFQFRSLSGSMSMKQRAKALHDFQSDPPTTIFLLSMRAGNCGINLTQANCVFLMEPGFNPALEQQAVGRVHRLGQKRSVEVVRLLVKDSVETRIRTFLDKKYNRTRVNSDGEEKEGKEAVEACVVGNIATEKPKSLILADEFDILFGVDNKDLWKPKEMKQQEKDDDDDDDMPDGAISSSFI